MSPEPVDAKFKAFGWEIINIDGHDYRQIMEAFQTARQIKGKPTMIVAQTIKGKGCSFMENKAEWHGTAPNPEQTKQALAELV
jgi:transketolase